ncbi:MAG: hypothetical protein ACWGQW_00150 [bacterium]
MAWAWAVVVCCVELGKRLAGSVANGMLVGFGNSGWLLEEEELPLLKHMVSPYDGMVSPVPTSPPAAPEIGSMRREFRPSWLELVRYLSLAFVALISGANAVSSGGGGAAAGGLGLDELKHMAATRPFLPLLHLVDRLEIPDHFLMTFLSTVVIDGELGTDPRRIYAFEVVE